MFVTGYWIIYTRKKKEKKKRKKKKKEKENKEKCEVFQIWIRTMYWEHCSYKNIENIKIQKYIVNIFYLRTIILCENLY